MVESSSHTRPWNRWAALVGGLLHFFVGQGFSRKPGGQVGDAADAAHLQPHMPGGNGLAGSAHAHGVGPQGGKHPDFRRGFILGPGGLQVHPLL